MARTFWRSCGALNGFCRNGTEESIDESPEKSCSEYPETQSRRMPRESASTCRAISVPLTLPGQHKVGDDHLHVAVRLKQLDDSFS